MIIKQPLMPEQIKQSTQPSEESIRQAQDALFMYLFERVAELEAKVDPPPVKKSRKAVN